MFVPRSVRHFGLLGSVMTRHQNLRKSSFSSKKASH
jgi:hypothetical protein